MARLIPINQPHAIPHHKKNQDPRSPFNPWIEREDCPSPTVLVIARLDRAIQKLAQHAS